MGNEDRIDPDDWYDMGFHIAEESEDIKEF